MRRIVGDEATAVLGDALAQVTKLVPYLTARIDPVAPPGAGAPTPSEGAGTDRPVPADGQWMPAPALLGDAAWLGRIIRATGTGIGTDDPVVAASIFVQGYSYRVLTVPIACLTASGVVPDASPTLMTIGLSGNWPSLVSFSRPEVMALGPPGPAAPAPGAEAVTDGLRFVVETAIEAHLRPLLAAVHAGLGVPVGDRLLWGNVAASAATAFRTMAGCLGRVVEPWGERFFALVPPELTGLGSFCVVEHDGRRGWFWERTNCCLVDRLPGAVRCADCSRTPAAERRSAYRDSLG